MAVCFGWSVNRRTVAHPLRTKPLRKRGSVVPPGEKDGSVGALGRTTPPRKFRYHSDIKETDPPLRGGQPTPPISGPSGWSVVVVGWSVVGRSVCQAGYRDHPTPRTPHRLAGNFRQVQGGVISPVFVGKKFRLDPPTTTGDPWEALRLIPTLRGDGPPYPAGTISFPLFYP